MSQPKQVQRRFVEEFQGHGDETVLDDLMADDFVDHSPMPDVPPTKEGVRGLFAYFRSAMPDMRVEIHDMISEGETVATRKTFIGTHQGELMGAAPSGKELRVDVIDFVRIRDGKISEHWNLVDTAGLMAQLGSA